MAPSIEGIGDSDGLSWSKLSRGGADGRARREALELARALAAQTIVLSEDAVVEELGDRIRAIVETMGPGVPPFDGYQLHSSLGAFLVTKVAVGWAPSGLMGLRHEPLDRQGLLEDLVEQGIPRARASQVLGDFTRVSKSFTPDPMGLDVSRIAGLAEGTLSAGERERALSQVASSHRCLLRLAFAVNVLSTLRTLLPILSPDAYGPRFSVAMFALGLDRPGRALSLLGGGADSLANETLAELARAMSALARGDRPTLDDRGMLLVPELEAEVGARADASTESDERARDSEDVVEIVEARIGPKGATSAGPLPVPGASPRRLPVPARFGLGGLTIPRSAARDLERYIAACRGGLGAVASGRLLGLSWPPPVESFEPELPPDERLLEMFLAEDRLQASMPYADALAVHAVGSSPLDAVLPGVRGLIRSIFAALDGRAPSSAAQEAAGDLSPFLLRIRALARIASDDLDGALDATRSVSPRGTPESVFVLDRVRRRKVATPTRAELNTLAVRLLRDLVWALGRTLAGTSVTRAPSDTET